MRKTLYLPGIIIETGTSVKSTIFTGVETFIISGTAPTGGCPEAKASQIFQV